MRQILLNLAVSLDGYIEGPKGEFDWCFTDQDYGMTEFLERTDSLLMGRNSYELLMQTSPDVFSEHVWYVCSNTLAEVRPGAQLLSGNIEAAVRQLRQAPGRGIWLFGGARLTASLLDAGLVDELILSIHPILLGGGMRLFPDRAGRIQLDLLGHAEYHTGLVQLRYGVRQAE
ncbi:MAG: dihydrofolate reductase family protein [Bacteroidia bacterium]|nr:dihydrofolate reductase family protein [Bacteroidia bacterium]